MLEDLFSKRPLKRERMICHSGGAIGSDTVWEEVGEQFGIKTNAYSYKTKSHQSPNKVEISESDYKEGIHEINRANKVLNRYGINKYMSLLARNWSQVKYSKQIFAIGMVIKPGCKDSKGYYNKSKYEIVAGGTGYCVMMGILNERDVYVFEQNLNKWFRWSYNSLRFVEVKDVKITEHNFAGVGTREINPDGIKAIKELFEKTFKI
jgi:hypothetical protein